MSKHTPGPWSIRTDPSELRLFGIVASHEYERGERCSVWVAREVSEENTRLIAAAPELLAACKKNFVPIRNISKVNYVGT